MTKAGASLVLRMNIPKNLFERTIVALIFVGFISWGVLLHNYIAKIQPQGLSAPTNTDTAGVNKYSALPVRLIIPKINVDAPIEYVNLTPNGEMGSPKNIANVAWFQLGPRPGEKGNAVIAGHYGWENSLPAVFNNVKKLQIGDKISVINKKGLPVTFVAREFRHYKRDSDSSSVFVAPDSKAHLILITCEGIWDDSLKSYTDRLVVFADKE